MRECPECGAGVPEDGTFCPECGTRVTDSGGRGAHTHAGGHASTTQRAGATQQPGGQAAERANERSAERDDGWPDEQEDWKYPVETTKSRPEDHKLLLGGVVGLSLVGLLEGVVQILYADTLVELAEEEFGLGSEFAAEQLVFAGGFGVVVSLAVVAATVYFYREERFRKAYFWGLVGAGLAGFLLAQSLFLTALAAFGLYGLLVVLD